MQKCLIMHPQGLWKGHTKRFHGNTSAAYEQGSVVCYKHPVEVADNTKIIQKKNHFQQNILSNQENVHTLLKSMYAQRHK